jgi:hypothetical protein
VIVIVLDKTGDYTAYEMGRNVPDEKIANAVLTNLKHMIED